MTHADPDHWPMTETAERAALQRDIQSLWRTNAALLAQVKSLEADLDLSRARANVCAQVVAEARELVTHDCQTCRETWDDAREAIVMHLAIVLDRLPKESV